MVRLRTRGWMESRVHILPGPSDFSVNGYPDRAVFVQVCYFLSTISRCTLLEKGRKIVSLGNLDCRFHKVAQWWGGGGGGGLC